MTLLIEPETKVSPLRNGAWGVFYTARDGSKRINLVVNAEGFEDALRWTGYSPADMCSFVQRHKQFFDLAFTRAFHTGRLTSKGSEYDFALTEQEIAEALVGVSEVEKARFRV